MRLPRMYAEFAQYWPLISDPADYAGEAGYWRRALRSKLGAGRHDILELGVGGGNNLSHLTGDFEATAVDISPQMLEQAKKLNPQVEFHVGDMRSVRLGRKFKAVIIHDAIDYMLSEDDLRETFATTVAHLRQGGVFITSPDWLRESFKDPSVSYGTNTDGQTIFTNLEYTYDPNPADTMIESLSWYLIRKGPTLRIEQDRHVMGLFAIDIWLRLMEEAGFDVEKIPYDVHEDHREAYLLVGILRG